MGHFPDGSGLFTLARDSATGTVAGPAVVSSPGVVEVGPPTTCDVQRYVHVAADRAIVSDSLEAILALLRSEGTVPEVDPITLSSQLNHIIWVTPTTAFRGISRLVVGQAMAVRFGSPPGATVTGDAPYLDRHSRGDQVPDTRRLLDLLAAATERRLASGTGRAILMLSSGKDSTALALAIAELGRTDIPCVTFAAGPDDPEVGRAAETCRLLGLRHEVVTMPARDTAARALRSFFASTAVPSSDLALVPYALAMARVGERGAVVLDGTGNDLYFGSVEDRSQATKRLLRVRGRRLADALTRIVPVDSPANYLLRSRVAAPFPGRMMRHAETRSIYPDAVDTHAFLYQMSRMMRENPTTDLLARTRDRYNPQSAPVLKLHLAATAVGMIPAMPFCDRALADYCFHLPEPWRVDRAAGTNKVLLRHMLLEFAGYDAAAIGKRPFIFDGARFLAEHREMVLEEIAACRLWAPEASVIAARWLEQLGRRPFLHHALLGWFQLSAWHNHSTYLAPVTSSGSGRTGPEGGPRPGPE